ncbi:hypothetical protein BDZ89DRAFT_1077528, partial [Hymenopellis radicata]
MDYVLDPFYCDYTILRLKTQHSKWYVHPSIRKLKFRLCWTTTLSDVARVQK